MSKTADKILEGLIADYSDGHCDHICAIMRTRDNNLNLPCNRLMNAIVKKLGPEKAKELLKVKVEK